MTSAERLARLVEGDEFGFYSPKHAAAAVDDAKRLIDQLKAGGARIVFDADLHAAMPEGVILPLRAEDGENAGCIYDADGDQIAVVDVDREMEDDDAAGIAASIVAAVNACFAPTVAEA